MDWQDNNASHYLLGLSPMSATNGNGDFRTAGTLAVSFPMVGIEMTLAILLQKEVAKSEKGSLNLCQEWCAPRPVSILQQVYSGPTVSFSELVYSSFRSLSGTPLARQLSSELDKQSCIILVP